METDVLLLKVYDHNDVVSNKVLGELEFPVAVFMGIETSWRKEFLFFSFSQRDQLLKNGDRSKWEVQHILCIMDKENWNSPAATWILACRKATLHNQVIQQHIPHKQDTQHHTLHNQVTQHHTLHSQVTQQHILQRILHNLATHHKGILHNQVIQQRILHNPDTHHNLDIPNNQVVTLLLVSFSGKFLVAF